MTLGREIYVATTNDGKFAEFADILAKFKWKARRSDRYLGPDETDTSYEENAALKARALVKTLNADGVDAPILGDDSGLEVDSLGGRPGILSARYGGPSASWQYRRDLLLAEVDAVGTVRTARFVCALYGVYRSQEYSCRATLDGSIVVGDERGDEGFSYDAIFVPHGEQRTFAQYSSAEKNSVSHRALAVAALLPWLDRIAALQSG